MADLSFLRSKCSPENIEQLIDVNVLAGRISTNIKIHVKRNCFFVVENILNILSTMVLFFFFQKFITLEKNMICMYVLIFHSYF